MPQDPSPPRVAVIGGGPAGLMAAEVLAQGGAAVTVYERMPSLGRKFLLAGRGGLNLTHSEPLGPFLARYSAAGPHLRAAVEAFPPAAVRAWCEGLGQKTFVGSSGRVFPKTMKASPLLRAWLRRLDGAGVAFRPRHRWLGFGDGGSLRFTTEAGAIEVATDATVLALGGASWPRLGSDGGWVGVLEAAGVKIAPLAPANCGFLVDWSEVLRRRFEGEPLKRVELAFDGARARGDVIVTKSGLEGGAIYALAAPLRDTILQDGAAVLTIDLRPDMTAAELAARLAKPRGKQSLATFLRKAASLAPAAIGLLHEAPAAGAMRLGAMDAAGLARLIKAVPVTLTAPAPIERAISSAGGVAWAEVDEHLMLRPLPGVFVAGEMLDWEAPTGGYLLQACFATGALAGRGVLDWLAREAT